MGFSPDRSKYPTLALQSQEITNKHQRGYCEEQVKVVGKDNVVLQITKNKSGSMG